VESILIVRLFFIVIFFHSSQLLTVVKGSETVVSVEPAYTFLSTNTDNTMLGFGWFKNGFSLEDATTTCTFDSVYPISGNVDLNGGTLRLNQDLVFKNNTTLLGLGTVVGNGYIFDMCSSVSYLPADTQKFEGFRN